MTNYRQWRLAVDSVQSPGLNVGIQFFKISSTAGGASVFTGGTPSASSEYNSAYVAARAFDDDNTLWASTVAGIPGYVQYDLGAGNATSAEFLEVRAYPPNHGYSPKLMRLQGSNDGTTWTELLSVDIAGYTLSDAYVINSLGTLRIPIPDEEPPLPPPEPPLTLASKGVSIIIHTSPIRQIGENPAFDAAQPRHKTQVTTGPLRSTIGGENDNMTISFAAGDQLQAAMLSANGKRVQVFNGGEIEFDGAVNSVRFDVGFVQISGAL